MAFDRGYALLVGVGKYQDSSLNALATATDANNLAAVLQNPQAAGYPADQVTLLTNEKATRAGVLAALQDLATKAEDDNTVLIFLCGHGMAAPDGKTYYFLPYDAKRSWNGLKAATAINSQELIDAVSAIKAHKVLIVFNTCFSGVVAGTLAPEEQAEEVPSTPPPADLVNQVLSAGQGRVVISACKSDQRSWYDATSGPTLFGQHLIAAIDGTADISNGRGFIGLFELYEYVYDKVHSGIKQLNAEVDQQPVITVHEGVGPFPLALYRGGQGVAVGNLDPTEGLKPEPTEGAVEKLPPIQAGRDAIVAGRDVNQASQGGVVNTGQMGNVQTGSGTQWNIGSVSAGRDSYVNSTVDQSQRGGIRTGDNAQFHGPVASGDRSVAVGGNVSGGSFVTGDHSVGGDSYQVGDVSGSGIAIGRGAQASSTTHPSAPLDTQTVRQVKELLDLLLHGAMAAAVAGALPMDLAMAVGNEVNAAKTAADSPNARQAMSTHLQKIADMAGAGPAGASAAAPLAEAVQTAAQTVQIPIHVDLARREQDVAGITGTDYFRDLQQKAAQIRADRARGPAPG